MTLQYSTEKCNPPLPIDDEDNVVRGLLIECSPVVGFNKITNDNWMEFYVRLHLLETMSGNGSILVSKGKEYEARFVEPKEVKRWVGLTTNSSSKTRSQFMKTISNIMDSDLIVLKRHNQTSDL